MGTELRHLLAVEVEGARLHAGVSSAWLIEHSGIDPEAFAALMEERVDFTVVDLGLIAAALDIPITALLPGSVAGQL
jgi:hypothetical protein